jgi:hypothetical protein
MVKIHNKDILLGITGKDNEWEKKLSDLNSLRVETALCFERFDQTKRKKFICPFAVKLTNYTALPH